MKYEKARIVIFAHSPPPDHGQSRMVEAMIRALEGRIPFFHVNARFSESTRDIGSPSPWKALSILRYLVNALYGRLKHDARVLYYIPGPVKWSAVLRDWIILGCLRPAFPVLVLHWHAIGQGEWSAGRNRVRLPGPAWIDSIARRVSRWIIFKPQLSIAVGPGALLDAYSVQSQRVEIVCNGISDPCPGFDKEIPKLRARQADELARNSRPLRVLFLARGSIEKGVTDALESLGVAAKSGMKIHATFAGGLDADVAGHFIARMEELRSVELEIELTGFLDEAEKARCFVAHDLLLSTSRWESFGLTIVEAMAWGLPVVATSSDGARGILPDNYPYLAAVADISGLGDLIIRCGIELRAGRGVELSTMLRNIYLNNYTLEHYEFGIRKALTLKCSK